MNQERGERSGIPVAARPVDMTGTDQLNGGAARRLTPSGPAPLYRQLSDVLREEIRRGVHGPLDRLPSEHELAREHAISRITARQALAELERAGLVFRLQGRGSFVARPAVVQRLSQLTGFAEAMSTHGFESSSRLIRAGTVRAPGPVTDRLRLPSRGRACESSRRPRVPRA